MNTKKILTLCTIIFPCIGLFSQDTSSFDERLSTFVKSAQTLQNQGLLDGPVLITKGDKIILNLANDKKNTPQYMLGSVSKQFLSVALLKKLYDSTKAKIPVLKIEELKTTLQLPIAKFLPPQSPLWAGKMPEWANIVTIHQLLSHTGGLIDYLDVASDAWKKSYHSPEEIIQLIIDKPLLFQPGTQYSYSNTDYVLLAQMLEILTGKSFSQYLQTTLFQPLSLTSTSNPEKGSPNGELQKNPLLSRLVFPMNFNIKGDQRQLYPAKLWVNASVAKGSGGIVSTAYDLLTWNQALHQTEKILPQLLYDLFTTPVLNNYAYGIAIMQSDIGTVLFHGGQIDSYRSYVIYLKEQDVHIILLSNTEYDEEPLMAEFKALLEELKSKIPDENQREKVAEQILMERYPTLRGMTVLEKNLKTLLGVPS